MGTNKVKTYVGFAIKKSSIVFGVDNIVSAKKRIKIILIDEKLSDNSTERVTRYATERAINILHYSLNELLPNRNCLALGVTDENLANAIETSIKER